MAGIWAQEDKAAHLCQIPQLVTDSDLSGPEGRAHVSGLLPYTQRSIQVFISYLLVVLGQGKTRARE